MEPVQIQPNIPTSGPNGPGTNSIPPYYSAIKQYSSPLPFSSEWDESFAQQQSPLKSKMTYTMAQLASNGIAKSSEKNARASPAHTVTSNSMRSPTRAEEKIRLPKADSAEPTPPPSDLSPEEVSPIDVFWAMVNDITGKDKLAKFGQYSLRLLLHHSKQAEAYLSDEKLNIRSINKTYQGTDKMLDLIINFVRNPRAFARVVVILICSTFTSRLSGVVPALAMFRQFLRFGKSPFRINALLKKVRNHLYFDKTSKVWRIQGSFFSKNTLGELISLYYSVNDESLLLFKLKFLQNKTWRRIAGRHESYAWYCDSWFALYNAWSSLQSLSQQEMDIQIQIRVKQRAKALSKELLGGTALHASHLDDETDDQQLLKEIRFKKSNAMLDIYKTLSDIIFNSYTVFNMKLHFATVQIWMGISASFLSSVKLYRQKKQSLESK
ncbi:putative peroxisomal membrane protein [Clavispora lusitaniae]|uniref:Peroxisomal membrane protein n=2 Tax=Clavispora lusitaniae TaxID=36911 RepID=C4Y3V5_CLAL4|nr:uncharacterized protein CLUG_02327 [Clavispora lusitaniae ATCC 42720]KAF5211536.1 hypothetical protein E0198_002851 [Clavispora lusitaniae]EEQ38201.1 hypothetical protein CLUG_02327 [Clavispora lusitaniae ATCC 42720]KAF7580394.1 hypothetical protein FOB63_005464 [Clavispora lusitaniae]QFZ27961.1 putative peroxisomal membrane protein [Clavispora lusitaniae]QFZ32732.1 putative peroxisomal membrane protein [Clavispora lusitaniae]